ncbi:MAG: M50 family metallopeptidase [Fimbriimonadaceae bacterium]
MTVLYILQIALMFTVLVAAHELGHFLVARFFKMEVEEFSIGMGLPKWVYARRNGTEFTLRAIPLGGFVRVKGMEPENDGSEVDIPNGFYSKGPMPRIWMLLAGPVFSMIAGVILLTFVWGTQGQLVGDNAPVVRMLVEGSPAAKAGIKLDDKIVSVDGLPIKDFFSVIKVVRENKGTPVTFVVERAGKQEAIVATPEIDNKPTPYALPDLSLSGEERVQAKVGIGYGMIRKPLSFGAAFAQAFVSPVLMAKELLSRLTNLEKLKEAVGGPETMARVSYAAAKEGPLTLMQLAGMLSMSLGIFNLLPIFPLDGGQITVALAELIRKGKRLSIGAQGRIQTVGLCAVALLIISVAVIDRQRDWSGGGKVIKTSPDAIRTE